MAAKKTDLRQAKSRLQMEQQGAVEGEGEVPKEIRCMIYLVL